MNICLADCARARAQQGPVVQQVWAVPEGFSCFGLCCAGDGRTPLNEHNETMKFSPPPALPSGEEPMAAGGWCS